MSRIIVDGKEYQVNEGENLLHACLSHGLEVPYFCWHPAMGSVGACRQCAVVAYQDEDDTQGRLTMACMTPASDGSRLDIHAPQAEEFRASVIEWLMENHPHDCPVCEEGGECHLQDMTVMTGHTARRYRGNKRTFENQQLGPFINHEMNRCITCYRCVRFYRDYAGGTDLEAFGSRSRMYFGRAEPGVLASEFSGNLVEVCPTGVFTDKPFSEMYSRKWDLQSAPSVCTGCSLGCNSFASERYGELRRIHNRHHPDVNKYFICDRGRFGMHYVNSESRIRFTGERVDDDVFQQIEPATAAAKVATLMASGKTVGIGSPRASLEDNWALRKLVGAENYCAGYSAVEHSLMSFVRTMQAVEVPTLTEMESADAVLILGEDLLNTAPRMALALRQAVRNVSHDMAADAGIPQWQDAGVRGHAQQQVNPLFSATVLPTRLDDAATQTVHAPPSGLARIAAGIAGRLQEQEQAQEQKIDSLSEVEEHFVSAVAAALATAERPLIVTGVSHGELALLQAAQDIAVGLQVGLQNGPSGKPGVRLAVCGSEANSFGVSQLDEHMNQHINIEQMLQALKAGQVQNLLVLENDLYRRADGELVSAALAAAEQVVVLDCLDNPTASAADLVFPAATVVESTGSLVNFERRAQRFYQVFEPADDVRAAWRWLVDIAAGCGRSDLNWRQVDDVLADIGTAPGFSDIATIAPGAAYRSRGSGQKVPREPHRYSGRTAMYAAETMHEPKTRIDEETPFSYSMEGLNADQPPDLIPYVWAPGWNSNQALFKFQQEVGGRLQGGSPGVRLSGSSLDSTLVESSRQNDVVSPSPDQQEGLRIITLPALFGGEELSAYSPAIRQRMERPFVVLHPDDATQLEVAAGDGVRCGEYSLEVKIEAAMQPGHAGVSVGMPDAPAYLGAGQKSLVRDADFVRSPTIIARG